MDSKWINVLAAGGTVLFWNIQGSHMRHTSVNSHRHSDSKGFLTTVTTHCQNVKGFLILTVQMSVMFWPISQCWKSGHWSRPSPERLLWEGRSISSVPIYTVPASIERWNEARSSQQSGQEAKGCMDQNLVLTARHVHCNSSPNQYNRCNNDGVCNSELVYERTQHVNTQLPIKLGIKYIFYYLLWNGCDNVYSW